MKISILNILFVLIVVLLTFAVISITVHFKCRPSDLTELPLTDDVHIGPNGMCVPLNRFILIRKSLIYGAVKFTGEWSSKSGKGMYANYESYFQGDGTGDFMNDRVLYRIGKLSWPESIGIGRLSFGFGNTNVECGLFKLEWTGNGYIYFYNSSQAEGDYGIELAPTIWTDIAQVNVNDDRIRWYRFDENRPDQTIPIDKLWE